MSVFLILPASSTVLPFSHSVARLDDAIALPHPNVLNFASSMTPVWRFTLICSFITSPHSGAPTRPVPTPGASRSEEHTSELQSPYDLVCRLLLEKKKKQTKTISTSHYTLHLSPTLFFFMIRPPPRPTLFPYTTLFRSTTRSRCRTRTS